MNVWVNPVIATKLGDLFRKNPTWILPAREAAAAFEKEYDTHIHLAYIPQLADAFPQEAQLQRVKKGRKTHYTWTSSRQPVFTGVPMADNSEDAFDGVPMADNSEDATV
jgi:hypothetical protein